MVEAEKVTQPQSGTEGEQALSKDACTWAMLCHIVGLAWLILPAIGGIIGPLVIWQLKRDTHSFVDEQGKEALNFQISMLIYLVVSGLLCFTCIGFVLVPIVAVIDIILAIVAAVKTANGDAYRYPLTIRFIK